MKLIDYPLQVIRSYNELLALPNDPSALATRLLELTDKAGFIALDSLVSISIFEKLKKTTLFPIVGNSYL